MKSTINGGFVGQQLILEDCGIFTSSYLRLSTIKKQGEEAQFLMEVNAEDLLCVVSSFVQRQKLRKK